MYLFATPLTNVAAKTACNDIIALSRYKKVPQDNCTAVLPISAYKIACSLIRAMGKLSNTLFFCFIIENLKKVLLVPIQKSTAVQLYRGTAHFCL